MATEEEILSMLNNAARAINGLDEDVTKLEKKVASIENSVRWLSRQDAMASVIKMSSYGLSEALNQLSRSISQPISVVQMNLFTVGWEAAMRQLFASENEAR
jgi:hypothetical protein